jgi:hypothetical protein
LQLFGLGEFLSNRPDFFGQPDGVLFRHGQGGKVYVRRFPDALIQDTFVPLGSGLRGVNRIDIAQD